MLKQVEVHYNISSKSEEQESKINGNIMKVFLKSSFYQFISLQINRFEITPGTGRGEHFASIMFRVNVHFSCDDESNQEISLIIKTFPVEEGFKKDVLGTLDLFEKEILVYTKVVDECKEILKKCGYHELFAPELVYHSLKPHKVLIFEDLKKLGYSNIKKFVIGDHETRLVYSKLAQYHAITFKMLAEGREDLNYKATIFNIPVTRTMDFYRNAPKHLAYALQTAPGYEVYAEKLYKLDFDWLMDKCLEAVSRSTFFKVLNHGDYHLLNMMFKDNEFGALAEVVLIDFQLPHMGSPAYDLIYMATAIPYSQRENAFRHYFNIFSDVLIKTGYKGKRPTYEDLQNELKNFAYADLMLTASLGVFVHVDRSTLEEKELENILTDHETQKKHFRNPAYIEHIKEVIPNVFDIIGTETN